MTTQPPRQPGDGAIEVKWDGEHILAVVETDGTTGTLRMGPFNAWRMFGMLALFLDIDLPQSFLAATTDMGELRSVTFKPETERVEGEWWLTARVGAQGTMTHRNRWGFTTQCDFVVVKPWDGAKIKLYGPRGQARYFVPSELEDSYLLNTVRPDDEFREWVVTVPTWQLLDLARNCWGIDTTPGRIVHCLCIRLESTLNDATPGVAHPQRVAALLRDDFVVDDVVMLRTEDGKPGGCAQVSADGHVARTWDTVEGAARDIVAERIRENTDD